MSLERWIVCAALVAAAGLASVASADHDVPEQARKFRFSIVQSMEACVAPNDSSPVLGLPACSPSAPADRECRFTQDGRGEVAAKVAHKGARVRVLIEVEGIEGCEGELLEFVVGARATEDNCGSGHDCTVIDIAVFPTGVRCVVEDGQCETEGFEELVPSPFAPGNNASVAILGCGLMRVTGADAPVKSFDCGLLVP